MAKKNPYFKFYAKDLLADETLRLCSLETRGLWIYVLSLMHRCVPRGYLVQENGKPMTTAQLARLASCQEAEADRCINELLSAGVFDVSDDGRIYSRRMVKETGISESRSAAGSKGAAVTNATGQKFAAAKPSANARQTGRQTLGKSVGMGIEEYTEIYSEKAQEENLGNDPPRDGGLGEGILPRQNRRQNLGKTEFDDLSPEWLARIWCNECRAMRGRIARDKPEDISPQFAEWVAFGVPASEIDAEMKTPRDRTEHLWQFKQRLFDRLGIGKTSRKPKAQEHAENEAAFNAELAKLLADNPAFKEKPP